MSKDLIELIKKAYKGDFIDNFNAFTVKELKTNNGSMIFSKNEKYLSSEIEKFSPTYLFTQYSYKHRYFASYKISDKSDKTLIYVLYNPSYANPENNDDTIKNCINLAERSGYGVVEIINLFSLRAPNPSKVKMKNSNDTNREFILNYLTEKKDDNKSDIVFAWGHGKENDSYCKQLIEEIKVALENKESFVIGVDTELLNTINHHPDKRVWNGLGGFENLSVLVPCKK